MIADVLNECPMVPFKIVGHTDSNGNEVSNLDLSKRRVASVKSVIVMGYGISADRIETVGNDKTQEIAPTDV